MRPFVAVPTNNA